MKKKIVSILLCTAMVATMAVGCGGSGDSGSDSGSDAKTEDDADSGEDDGASDDGSTVGKNTFVDGGTEMALWTFQELHVGFYTELADKWNEANPDKAINLTVTTGESRTMQSKMLMACQSNGEGAPDIRDIEIGNYASFVAGDYLLPLNDVVEPYKDDIVMSRVEMYGDGDNWYGIDFHLGASVTYYNMDIMDEAGVDPAGIVT